jgi:sulfide:quinone oxidoreductase
MKLITVNEHLSVSGQIEIADIGLLAKEGVEVVLCNRPDNEEAKQPSFSVLAAAANAAGIEAIALPFKAGEMQSAQVEEMTRLLQRGKRLHAFCRSGNRSFCLYAAAHASVGLAKKDILQQAEVMGIAVKEIIEPYYKDGKNNEH